MEEVRDEKEDYFAGASRIAVRKDGTLSFLLSDHLGSSSVTADANGAKTASALYKAFGETRYTLGSLNTDYHFTGQREESALGIYFFNARWYDGSLGRFLSPDTIVPTSTQGTQAWDRYAFVNNNPVRYNDPTGHEAGNCYDRGYCNTDPDLPPPPPPPTCTQQNLEHDECYDRSKKVLKDAPQTKVLHPISSNVVYSETIYDCSYEPCMPIGTIYVEYVENGDVQFDPWALVKEVIPIPNDWLDVFSSGTGVANRAEQAVSKSLGPLGLVGEGAGELASLAKWTSKITWVYNIASGINKSILLGSNLQIKVVYFQQDQGPFDPFNNILPSPYRQK